MRNQMGIDAATLCRTLLSDGKDFAAGLALMRTVLGMSMATFCAQLEENADLAEQIADFRNYLRNVLEVAELVCTELDTASGWNLFAREHPDPGHRYQ